MFPEHLRVRAGRGGQRARHDDELIIPLPHSSLLDLISAQHSSLCWTLEIVSKSCLPHFRLVVCASGECECVTPNTRDTKWEGGTRRSGVLHEACERKGRGQPHVRLRPEEGGGGGGGGLQENPCSLPSFTSILLSPCGSRLLRARRAKGAMDSGQDADSLCCCGLPRPPRKGSRSPPARSGRQSQTRLSFWPNCSFQHSKEPRGRRL